MERLIHDLLDFSRVDARGTDHFVRTNCDETLNDAIRNLHSLIEENQAVVTLGESADVVLADPGQMTRRLFQNLLVNSIRYRSEEPPHVHIGAEPREGEWLFSVKDNGIGIEPEYAEKVFGIFKCLQPRDKYPGSGMGLAICRKIVTRHEGRIWVEESDLGKRRDFLLHAAPLDRIAALLTNRDKRSGLRSALPTNATTLASPAASPAGTTTLIW